MRSLTAFLILFSTSSIAHVKWMDYNSTTEESNINIFVSEGIIPFVAQRSFYIDRTELISTNGQILSSDSYLINQTRTSKGIIQNIVTQNDVGVIVIENGPLFKRAKLEKESGKFVPERIEFSRISMLHNPESLKSIKKSESLYLDLYPDQKNTLKLNSLFTLQVLKYGQPFKPTNVKIYRPNSKTETFDLQVQDNGILQFHLNHTGKYLVQVDDMSQISGFPGYPKTNHLHLFSSLIFSVAD